MQLATDLRLLGRKRDLHGRHFIAADLVDEVVASSPGEPLNLEYLVVRFGERNKRETMCAIVLPGAGARRSLGP